MLQSSLNVNAWNDVLDRVVCFLTQFIEAYPAQACAGPRPLSRVCERLTFDLKSRRQCRHTPFLPHWKLTESVVRKVCGKRENEPVGLNRSKLTSTCCQSPPTRQWRDSFASHALLHVPMFSPYWHPTQSFHIRHKWQVHTHRNRLTFGPNLGRAANVLQKGLIWFVAVEGLWKCSLENLENLKNQKDKVNPVHCILVRLCRRTLQDPERVIKFQSPKHEDQNGVALISPRF